MSQKLFSSLVFCTLASLIMGLATAKGAVIPLTSATVTRIENKATIGTVKNGQIVGERPAVVSDVIGSNSIFQTSSNGRAELEFSNKSLIRLGPNSVFSFDSSSRTVSLEKGNMLFYLPPGQGGVKIKTAAATAALTGTVVAVTENGIVVLEGTFTLTFVNAQGIQQSLTLDASDPARKAASFIQVNGEWRIDPNFTFQDVSSTLAQTATNLVSFAALPEGAELQISMSSPDLSDAIATAAATANSNADPDAKKTAEDVINALTPVATQFSTSGGGSAAAGAVTTRVLANGTIEVLDSAGNVIGNLFQ